MSSQIPPVYRSRLEIPLQFRDEHPKFRSTLQQNAYSIFRPCVRLGVIQIQPLYTYEFSNFPRLLLSS
jgi:hypothetical protein